MESAWLKKLQKNIFSGRQKMRENFFSLFYKFIIVTVGCAIYASGVAFFLDPNNIVTGGLTGI